MKELVSFIAVLLWVMGVALAKGFLATTFAIVFFPYAWYLVCEKAAISLGWL